MASFRPQEHNIHQGEEAGLNLGTARQDEALVGVIDWFGQSMHFDFRVGVVRNGVAENAGQVDLAGPVELKLESCVDFPSYWNVRRDAVLR